MKKYLHIALMLLPGLFVLAGCQREDSVLNEKTDPGLVTSGPVEVSTTLSLHCFGGDNVLTKGNYEPIDDTYIRIYDHERLIKDFAVFVFDATDAFVPDGGSPDKYKFDPTLTRMISDGPVTGLHKEKISDSVYRLDFHLDKPYKSLALLVMANFGDDANYTPSGIPGEGSTMEAVCNFFASTGFAYNPDQSHYLTNGVPMHGWKVFGSPEGLLTSYGKDSDEYKKCQLRYYKGMSTPLTTVGFKTVEELERYTGTNSTTGTGDVRHDKDYLPLTYALSRLHIRYVKDDTASGLEPWQIEMVNNEAKLKNYPDKFGMLPATFPGKALTPFEDPSSGLVPATVGAALITDAAQKIVFLRMEDETVTRKHTWVTATSPSVTTKTWTMSNIKTYSMVAYVPELEVRTLTADVPEMELKLKVIRPDEVELKKVHPEDWDPTSLDEILYYKYDTTNGITMFEADGTTAIASYMNPAWIAWLKMQALVQMDDASEPPVPQSVGTKFNWIRHYTYEWKATGVDK